MPWTDLVHGTEGLLAVFGGSAPDLDGVEIQAVRLEARLHAVLLDVILAAYPEAPPDKWAARGANAVAIELCLSGLGDVQLAGVLRPGSGDIGVARDLEGGVRLTATTGAFGLEAVGDAASILRLSAFQQGTACTE